MLQGNVINGVYLNAGTVNYDLTLNIDELNGAPYYAGAMTFPTGKAITLTQGTELRLLSAAVLTINTGGAWKWRVRLSAGSPCGLTRILRRSPITGTPSTSRMAQRPGSSIASEGWKRRCQCVGDGDLVGYSNDICFRLL